MVLKATRSIDHSIVKSVLTIDTLGTSMLTPEEEKEVMDNYKIVIDYSEIDFSKYVRIDNHKNPTIVSDSATIQGAEIDLVTLEMPHERYLLTEDLTLTYAVDAAALDMQSYTGKISDGICLAKAMILVWELAIGEFISQQMQINRRHYDSFENEVLYNL